MTYLEAARSHRGLLLATALALTVAWLTTNSPVPIYDGIGAPDEPYRYVSPPAGDKVRTQPPTSAAATARVTRGIAGVMELYTIEQGPQAQAFLVGQSLTVKPAPGTSAVPSSITATLTPLAPDSGPAGPRIDGNIYRLSWDAGLSTTQYRNEGADQVLLRAVRGPPPKATFLFRPSSADSWRRLPTNLAGADVYAAMLQGQGDYALTLDPSTTSAGRSTSQATSPHRRGGALTVWVTVVAAVVLLQLGVILIVRLHRARTGAE
jgi:hypothetical protein